MLKLEEPALSVSMAMLERPVDGEELGGDSRWNERARDGSAPLRQPGEWIHPEPWKVTKLFPKRGPNKEPILDANGERIMVEKSPVRLWPWTVYGLLELDRTLGYVGVTADSGFTTLGQSA